MYRTGSAARVVFFYYNKSEVVVREKLTGIIRFVGWKEKDVFSSTRRQQNVLSTRTMKIQKNNSEKKTNVTFISYRTVHRKTNIFC